jgi:hypothetical protein
LRQQLSEAERRIKDLQQTVISLNASLDSATREQEAAVETLRVQVMVYQEDFEAERKDRERAQNQLSELQTQLQLLQQNNMAQQQQQLARPTSHPVYQTDRRRTQYNNTGLQHGVIGANWDLFTDGVDELDGIVLQPDTVGDRRVTDAGGVHRCDVLRCPKCLRQFTVDCHAQLMQHIDECALN